MLTTVPAAPRLVTASCVFALVILTATQRDSYVRTTNRRTRMPLTVAFLLGDDVYTRRLQTSMSRAASLAR